LRPWPADCSPFLQRSALGEQVAAAGWQLAATVALSGPIARPDHPDVIRRLAVTVTAVGRRPSFAAAATRLADAELTASPGAVR
jgi:hypothetical protein